MIADVTFTAAGGAIAQFRYPVLYNDTAANDELHRWTVAEETRSFANSRV